MSFNDRLMSAGRRYGVAPSVARAGGGNMECAVGWELHPLHPRRIADALPLFGASTALQYNIPPRG